jgi:chromosome partitioning protein
MLIIGVLNSKGGVGKTLFASLLAFRAMEDFKRVTLVDLDPQGGSRRWVELRGPVNSPAVDKAGFDDFEAVMSKLKGRGCELAVLDGGPGSLDLTEQAIGACNVVVCPLRASDQDLASTIFVARMCADQGRRILYVVNSVQARGDKRAEGVRKMLEADGCQVVTVTHRVPFVSAMDNGQSPAELRGGQDAAAEIEKVYEAALALAKQGEAVNA